MKNSQPSRDLPTPPMPTMESSRALPSSPVPCRYSLSRRSSRSRPTNGGSSPLTRIAPPRPAATRWARQRRTGSVLPRAWCVPGVFVHDRGIGHLAGGVADVHRPRLGRGLDARGCVDEVPGDQSLADGSDVHGSLAGQDSGASAEAGGAHLVAEHGHGVDELERCPHRELGVVLLRRLRAPDGHHGVADELLDGAAVAHDDGSGSLEVAAQDFANVLSVALVGECREADQVGEQDGDVTPFRAPDGLPGPRRRHGRLPGDGSIGGRRVRRGPPRTGRRSSRRCRWRRHTERTRAPRRPRTCRRSAGPRGWETRTRRSSCAQEYLAPSARGGWASLRPYRRRRATATTTPPARTSRTPGSHGIAWPEPTSGVLTPGKPGIVTAAVTAAAT